MTLPVTGAPLSQQVENIRLKVSLMGQPSYYPGQPCGHHRGHEAQLQP